MYTDYFGFREKPFNATPDPRFFYTNSTISRVTQLLLSGIRERKGFIVLTGEAGTGKTTLLRKLMNDLDATVNFAFFYTTTLTFDELLSFACQDLGLQVESCDRLQKIEALKEFLISQLHQGRTTVVLVDEAQNLGEKTLENLQMLLDLETANEKLLQIVLVGQPELQLKLDQQRLRRLKEQVAIQCRLHCLKDWEAGPFIRYRLDTAGYERQDLFTREAIQQIALYSKGIPRLINIICDNALLIAYADSRKTVSAAMIDEVARDLRLKEESDVVKVLETVSRAEQTNSATKGRWGSRFTWSAAVRKQEELFKRVVSILAYWRHWKMKEAIERISPAGWMKYFWLKSSGIFGRIRSETIRILPRLATKVEGGWALYRSRQGTWLWVGTGLLALLLILGVGTAIYYPKAGARLRVYSLQESATTEKRSRARVVIAPELGFRVSGKGAQEPTRSLVALLRDGEAHLSHLEAAYEQELTSNPSVMGSLILDLTLEPDGKLSHVDFLSAKISSKKFQAVISEIVPAWRFSSASGQVRIHYPVLFIPAGIDAASIVAWEKSAAGVKTKLAAANPERFLSEVKEPGTYRVVLDTYVRSGPRDDAEVITSLKPPIEVWVDRVIGKYLEVLSLQGKRIRGYIHQEDAFLAPSE